VTFAENVETLAQPLYALLAAHPQLNRLVVGYSGGIDSHVLLHLLAMRRKLESGRTLEAVYVDHGLQTMSAVWGRHCADICHALNIPFRTVRINAHPAPGDSPEAAARQARYAALAAALKPDAALLTAHHRDDQAETLLLQLLRGAGPHGLAAMPVVAPLGQGWLLRPLLSVARADLLAYAQAQDLCWIEDASNTDTGLDRNYLRHRILPLLQERWPATSRVLARSARLCAETADWLNAEADADLAHVATARLDALSIPVLRELSELRQRNLLRRWLRTIGLPLPNSRQLQHILHDSLTAARDRQPYIGWPGGQVRRYRDTLYAMPPLISHDARQTFVWRPDTRADPQLELPGLGTLQLKETVGAGLRSELLDGATLTVRFRQGGERFRPVGRLHRQELKKLLQEAGIPPWQRERLPLLYRADALLAVVGLGIAANVAADSGEAGWEPILRHSISG
jgi:tRNA(Ile)-lysidine synthase